MSESTAEARRAAPFPLEPVHAAAPEAVDPLAGDWSEGLRGPVRALGIPQPRLLTATGEAPAEHEPDPAEPVADGTVEAPDAWAVAEDLAQAAGVAEPDVVELQAEAALDDGPPAEEVVELPAEAALEPVDGAEIAAAGHPASGAQGEVEAAAQGAAESAVSVEPAAHAEAALPAELSTHAAAAALGDSGIASRGPAEPPAHAEPAGAAAFAPHPRPEAIPLPGPARDEEAARPTDSAPPNDDVTAWTQAISAATAAIPAGDTPWSEAVAAQPAPAPDEPWRDAPIPLPAPEPSLWSASTFISAPFGSTRLAPALEAYGSDPAPLEAHGSGLAPLEAHGSGPAPLEAHGSGPAPLEAHDPGPAPLDAHGLGPVPFEAHDSALAAIEALDSGPDPEEGWAAPAAVATEWAPEAPRDDFQEVKVAADPSWTAAAPAADWGAVSAGPDWSEPAAGERSAAGSSAPAADHPAPGADSDEGWGTPPPRAPASSWSTQSPAASVDDWSAPAAPAAAAAPEPRWNAPPASLSTHDQLESDPAPLESPEAKAQLFAPLEQGASLSADGDEPAALGASEEAPEGDLILDEDPDLLVPVEDDEPAAPPAQVPTAPLAHVATVAVGSLFVQGEHRVAVHTRGGSTRRGTVRDIDLSRAQFTLLPQGGGAPESVHHADVKAIFFMLAAGEKQRPADGGKLKVTFADGRSIEGHRDGKGGAHGFFFVPTDAARTNTRRIYVARDAVSELQEA